MVMLKNVSENETLHLYFEKLVPLACFHNSFLEQQEQSTSCMRNTQHTAPHQLQLAPLQLISSVTHCVLQNMAHPGLLLDRQSFINYMLLIAAQVKQRF